MSHLTSTGFKKTFDWFALEKQVVERRLFDQSFEVQTLEHQAQSACDARVANLTARLQHVDFGQNAASASTLAAQVELQDHASHYIVAESMATVRNFETSNWRSELRKENDMIENMQKHNLEKSIF